MRDKVPKGVGLDKGLFVPHDVGAFYRGQYSDFVESVLLFLVRKVIHLDLFEGVNLTIGQSLHFVDTGVCTLA